MLSPELRRELYRIAADAVEEAAQRVTVSSQQLQNHPAPPKDPRSRKEWDEQTRKTRGTFRTASFELERWLHIVQLLQLDEEGDSRLSGGL